MEARIARLESDVSHLRSDVGEIKLDLRALRDKVDGLGTQLTSRIDAIATDVRTRGDLQDSKIDLLRNEIHSVRIWGLGLYIAFAGAMLTAMARGFGWV